MSDVQNELLEELKQLNKLIEILEEIEMPKEFKIKILNMVKKEMKDIETYLGGL